MGNEGSIPSSEDSEGFEYEGRSPPSATGPDGQPYVVAGMNMNNNNDPRLMNGGGNNGSGNNGSGGAAHHHNHHNHHHHHHESRPGGGGGGRLKGSVFTRRSNAHNQNSTGIERAPSAYAPSSVGSDTSGSSYHTSVNVMPGDDLEYMGRAGQQQQQQQQQQAQHQHQHQHQHDLLHQQQLQSYPGGHAQHQYQQQQQQQQQSMYGQQQHQHQQQPQPQYQQHYHHAAQQQTPPNHPHAHPFQQQQQQQQQPNGNNTTKKIRPGQRAGAAIINSMRNLNIGSAMHRIGGVGIGKSPANSPMRGGNSNSNNSNSKRQQMHKRQQQQQQQQQQQKQQQQQQVNEWEARWDNDSDEEDEDSVQNEGISTHTSSQQQQQQQQQHPHHPPSVASPPASLQQQAQILRPPEMDAGYMSAVSASPSNPLMVGTALQHQQQKQQQQQQQMGHHHHSAYSTIATTTDPSVAHAQAQAQAHAQLQTTQQQQQPVHVHVTDDETTNYSAIEGGGGDDDDDDDGVEWDTGAAAGNNKAGIPDDDAELDDDDDDDSKAPNVKQFLPLLRVLGKGSFGKVVLVQKRVGREQGSLFAMKILKKTHLVRRRQIERTRTERKVLSAVNHPFIMKLHYAFQTPEKLYLVLDYCPGGELFFHLSRFRRFPERVARFYAAELLLALGHLHKRGIIYRDLKPENVLLDAEGHVKLGDFGLAKAGIRHAYEGATSMCGTPEYMAPEVLAQQGHGFCVDYWGLGMLTYEMMTGLPPWYTTDRAKLFRRLRSAPLDIPPYFSASSASFSGALLERNPTRRLGVTGIRAAMEHEFFKSISWRALYGRRVEAPIRPCEGWSPPAASGGDESPSNSAHRQQHSLDQSLSSSSPQVQTQTTTTTTTTTIPTDLDAATANFDNQFTRMPVETEEDGNAGDDDDMEELHEDTFVGFTFDDNDRDEIEAAQQLKQQQQQQQQSRPRTHHYSREGHQID